MIREESQSIRNRVGRDGKKYPARHAPVNVSTGCTSPQELGRDPHASPLHASVGDLPVGYATEQLDAAGHVMQRHEDHVDQKVEWENDVRIQVAGGTSTAIEVRCDLLVIASGRASGEVLAPN